LSIRAVVFDAVGTLITPEPSAGEAYHAVGRRHGSARDAGEVARRFAECFRATLRTDGGDPHRTDEATERAFWRAVVAGVFDDLSADAAERCFQSLFAHFACPAAWRVFADVGPALRELHSRGRTLAVASNFDARLHGVFAGHPELAAIDRRFVSSEIGWRKPDRRFFAAVCDGLGRRPEEVLYVGDEPESDVAAASEAGLRSVLLRRGGPPGPGVLTDLAQLPPLLGPTSRSDPA
ncbi:MAG TPA: HAD-IA family hydrolase, partial [Planctomycetaceae bacterium]